MKKPVLVIMAAGMGSRYGGLKQIDHVGRNGEIILDYSLFDAKRAGFEKAIIVIKRENEALFREVIGDRASRQMEIQYAYQEMDDLPEGFSIPEGRKKPWGTATRCWRPGSWWTRPSAPSTPTIFTARRPSVWPMTI